MTVGKYSTLRQLDIDDLYLMHMMIEKLPQKVIAEKLGLTAPAVSQRKRKYEHVFEDFFQIDPKTGKRKRGSDMLLTDNGIKICEKAVLALECLCK